MDTNVGGWGGHNEAKQEIGLSPRARGVWLYVDGEEEGGRAQRGCMCVERGEVG